jgi:hypothetical protein
MELQYALVGGIAFYVLQLAGRFLAEQPHPWRDSFAGAVAFTIVLVVAPAIGGALGVGLLALTAVALLLLATIRPDQWQTLRRRLGR